MTVIGAATAVGTAAIVGIVVIVGGATTVGAAAMTAHGEEAPTFSKEISQSTVKKG